MKKEKINGMKKILIGSIAATAGIAAFGFHYSENAINAYTVDNQTLEIQNADNSEDGTLNPDEQLNGEEHISCVGSVSKVYVTTAAMQLVWEGKIRLDAPVIEYLPEFTMADERYKDITVSMLMNHTSGIMGTNRKNLTLYKDNDIKGFESTLDNLRPQRLKANPGEYAAYCNDGFNVLALIIERVSGMSYTDYVIKNIADKIGADHTGTAENLFEREDLASIYMFGNNRSDFEYCTSLGAGGIYATASDMARFGSGFFTGNNTLLTEESKAYMAKRWYEEEEKAGDSYDKDYMAVSASGWDYVSQKKYEDAGVKVLGKGGDINTQHSFLLVAPDEKISVGVLSVGGSSMYNNFLAQELLDEVLREMGKEIDDTTDFDVDLIEIVPDECKKFEGVYAIIGTSADEAAYKVRFEDNKLKVYSITNSGKEPVIYMPCSDNGFVKTDDNGNISADKEILYFEENMDGNTYIKVKLIAEVPSLGCYSSQSYVGQRMEEKHVSKDIIDSWKQYDGKDTVILNAKYSSQVYDAPFLKIRVYDELPGYVVGEIGMELRLLKIKDENVCEAFTTIPSDANRDLVDGKLERVILKDKREVLCFTTSDGVEQMLASDMPELTPDVKEVKLTSDEAAWFRVGDDMADTSVMVERPENSAVYVYNKYKDVVYTSHVTSPVDEISLPQGGYIVFLGETGGEILVK